MELREGLRLVWDGLLDVVYPPRCLVCGQDETEPLCSACRGTIVPLSAPYCDRCGVPVPAGRLVCIDCETGPEPPYAWTQAAGQYTGTLRTAIRKLKYERKGALATPLGRILANAAKAATPLHEPDAPFDCVVPVPLHPSKLRYRGFNQSERLARVVSEQCGWPLDTSGLQRVRNTRTQTRSHRDERLTNVQRVFDTSRPLYFSGKSVLLIDDVLTTGSTVSECSRVLRNAGARRVAVLALARGL